MSNIIHMPQGSFCPACQSVLTCEEIDWETCDACGGDGFPSDDDDDGFNPYGSGPVLIEPRDAS